MWKIVGGVGKGGLLVRAGEELNSQQLPGRLMTGALVEEIERKGQRLHFRLFSGLGPLEGWISLSVQGKVLAEASPAATSDLSEVTVHCDAWDAAGRCFRCRVPPQTTMKQLRELLAEDSRWQEDVALLRAKGTPLKDSDLIISRQPLHFVAPALLPVALQPAAAEHQGNEALRQLPSPSLARGLVLWRWQRLEMALQELEKWKEDSAELLALQIALGRWPQAAQLAKKLHLEEPQQLIEAWQTSSPGRFSPSPAVLMEKPWEVMPGVLQIDGLIPIEDVQLGLRLFLQVRDGNPEQPQTSRPLVLYFHGNAETVDTYTDPEVFEPLQASMASAIVADFRGYGFSTGSPSLATIATDGERVVEALPSFLAQHQLPWPWPGGLYLLGRSMGGVVACHLAALKGQLFQGVVLESTFCGSYAPGATPPEEPPQEAAGPLGATELRFWTPELQQAVERSAALCRKLVKPGMEELGLEEGLDAFVMGSEDKISAFSGRLLILHGEIDTIIPVSHARRLCDAASFATRRLVTVSKGHNDISYSAKYVSAFKNFLNGG